MSGNELSPRDGTPLNSGLPARYLSRIALPSHPVVDADPQVDAFGQLRATWDILVKHQWLVLATTALLTVLVAVYSFKAKPVYEATGRLDVEAELPLLQSLNELFRS